MGLFNFLRSLLKGKNEDEIEEKVRAISEESADSSELNVSAASNSDVSAQKMVERKENLHSINDREILWEMNKKLEELLEIKELYHDMLDWMVEMNRKEEGETSRNQSKTVPTQSKKLSNLSPRLRQVVEIVDEKGEIGSSDLSEEIDLSRNRCSELLNALFEADYLSKNRAGRKVYYRLNSDKRDIFDLEG